MSYFHIDTCTSLCQDGLVSASSSPNPNPSLNTSPSPSPIPKSILQSLLQAITREFHRDGPTHIITGIDCPNCPVERQNAVLGICQGCGGRSNLPAGSPNAWVRKQHEARSRAQTQAAALALGVE